MKIVEVRFETGIEGLDQLECFSNSRKAFRFAIDFSMDNKEQLIYVFDKMAKKGNPEIWFFISYILGEMP